MQDVATHSGLGPSTQVRNHDSFLKTWPHASLIVVILQLKVLFFLIFL